MYVWTLSVLVYEKTCQSEGDYSYPAISVLQKVTLSTTHKNKFYSNTHVQLVFIWYLFVMQFLNSGKRSYCTSLISILLRIYRRAYLRIESNLSCDLPSAIGYWRSV